MFQLERGRVWSVAGMVDKTAVAEEFRAWHGLANMFNYLDSGVGLCHVRNQLEQPLPPLLPGTNFFFWNRVQSPIFSV